MAVAVHPAGQGHSTTPMRDVRTGEDTMAARSASPADLVGLGGMRAKIVRARQQHPAGLHETGFHEGEHPPMLRLLQPEPVARQTKDQASERATACGRPRLEVIQGLR
jgi:glutamate 5-kinase